MKYIRKVMAAGLAIVFLIAVVIGTGVILSVRNVNVSFIDYSGAYKEEFETVRSGLNKLKGSGLLFVGSDDIYDTVTADEYLAVDGYEKKFPCTVNVVIRERVETFALRTLSGYKIYDERGKLIKTVPEADEAPKNRIDGCPDVLLRCSETQVEGVAALCGEFESNFGCFRRIVESVAAEKYLELKVATFVLRNGLKITVSEWETEGAQKIKKACETYSSLSDAQRTGGTITVAESKENGGVVSKYSPS